MANFKNIHDHSDIINKPYQKSKRHRWMSQSDRAAQFAPFSALTGHKEIISDMEKVFVQKKQLDDDRVKIIDAKLKEINGKKAMHPLITVTYFDKNEQDDFGIYKTKKGYLKKIDPYHQIIIMKDDHVIFIDDIYEIDLG